MAEPLEMALRIIELRAYAGAKEIVDKAEKMDDLPDSEMVKTVLDIQAEIAMEKGRKRGQP